VKGLQIVLNWNKIKGVFRRLEIDVLCSLKWQENWSYS